MGKNVPAIEGGIWTGIADFLLQTSAHAANRMDPCCVDRIERIAGSENRWNNYIYLREGGERCDI